MPVANVDGLSIAYEVIGQGGQPWAITPGGRFSKDYGGVREMAEALAERGRQVLIWDRPNCGASDVCFRGSSESDVQADTLAGLLRQLGMTPAVIVGGSGGSRVSLLTVARHPDVARALGVWWISGGPFGLMSLGVHYCGTSLATAWREGMEAVADLPEWKEVIERNPGNRQRILDQDPKEFVAAMERWMLVYYPRQEEVVPGLLKSDAARISVPTLVFRSGDSDVHHTRATSEAVAACIPGARLVEPPWGDREWIERGGTGESLFVRWPLLVPHLTDWADEVLTA
jgi:pimeloyl-ACP methyl ester carboxylesterase